MSTDFVTKYLFEPNLLVPRLKPIGPVKINWDHPLTDGLISFVLYGAPGLSAFDLVQNRIINPTQSAMVNGANRGNTFTAAGAISDYWDIFPDESGALPTTGGAVLLGLRKSDATNRSSVAFGGDKDGTASSNRFQSHCPFSDGTVYFDFGGQSAGKRISYASGSEIQNYSVMVFSAGPSGLMIARNGVIKASNQDAASRTQVSTPFRINRNGTGSDGDLSEYYFSAVFTKEKYGRDARDLSADPFQVLESDTAQLYNFPSAAVTSVTTGTAVPTQTEAEVVTGGKTIILTLTGDTWVAAGTGPIGSTADTQAIIDGLTAATTPTFGWNNEVRDKEVTTAVVRTSSTVCTITLTAAASYDISSTETITPTIPAVALVTSASAVVSTPTFAVTAVAAAGGLSSSLMMLGVGF